MPRPLNVPLTAFSEFTDRERYLQMAVQPAEYALHMVKNAIQHADCVTDKNNLICILDRLKEAAEMLREESGYNVEAPNANQN